MAQADQVREHYLRGDQLYRGERFLNFKDTREELRSLYEYWQNGCYQRIHEATRAANWLADAVRAEIDPMFLAIEGRFLLEEHINFQRYSVHSEYTAEQRRSYTENPDADFEIS